MKKSLLFICLLVASVEVFAGVKYVGHSTVKRYYPVGGTVTYLMLDAPHINPAACSGGSAYLAQHSSDGGDFEEYRKLILTAKASGQKIGVYVWDDKCTGAYPKIYSIFIQ